MKVYYFGLIIVLMLGCTCKKPSHKISHTERYENGNPKFISVIDTIRHEKCFQFFYENGNIEKEYCELKGEPNGGIKYYYSSGELEQLGTLVNGKLNGEYTHYYKNGKISEISFKMNDKKEGESKYFLADGRLRTIYVYIDDEAIYKKTFNYNEDKKVENIEEEMAPVANVSKETLSVGEELGISISLPRQTDLVHDKIGNYFAYIDIVKKEEEDQGLEYPSIEVIMKNGIGNAKIQDAFNEPGMYYVYGQLLYKLEDEEGDKEFNGFRIEVEVVE